MGWNAWFLQYFASWLKIQMSVLLLKKKIFQHAALNLQNLLKINLLNFKFYLRNKVIPSGVFQTKVKNRRWEWRGSKELPFLRVFQSAVERRISYQFYSFSLNPQFIQTSLIHLKVPHIWEKLAILLSDWVLAWIVSLSQLRKGLGSMSPAPNLSGITTVCNSQQVCSRHCQLRINLCKVLLCQINILTSCPF